MANKILYINNVKCMNVESRENLRRCAYDAFKNNESGYAVSRKLKVRESTVYRWYKEFKTKGETAISESKRGADVSEHAALSKEERNKLEKDVRACLVSICNNSNECHGYQLQSVMSQPFTIFPKASAFIQPSKRAFYYPSFLDNSKFV